MYSSFWLIIVYGRNLNCSEAPHYGQWTWLRWLCERLVQLEIDTQGTTLSKYCTVV